jgi:hypothetical protein
VKESAESGAPVLKLSTSQSCLPIKVRSDLAKTTFKQGQWVEAKKGSCPDTHRGVTQEGEFKTVCVNQKCSVHKHRVDQPQQRGESYAEQQKRQEEEKKKGDALEKHEAPIREKVWIAILGQMTPMKAMQIMAENQHQAVAMRKQIQKAWPKVDGLLLDCLTVFACEFERCVRPSGYWMVRDGVAKNRQPLWELAKVAGIDANAIAAKHFHDLGSIAPAADVLYPKGIPWPKEGAKASPTKQASKPAKKVAKKAAKKAGRK